MHGKDDKDCGILEEFCHLEEKEKERKRDRSVFFETL